MHSVRIRNEDGRVRQVKHDDIQTHRGDDETTARVTLTAQVHEHDHTKVSEPDTFPVKKSQKLEGCLLPSSRDVVLLEGL